jgi:hypothetical protein
VLVEAVLAQLLAVVRGDDDDGLIEDAATPQRREQVAELPVQVGEAVVVGIADQILLVRGEAVVVGRLATSDHEF